MTEKNQVQGCAISSLQATCGPSQHFQWPMEAQI